MRSAQDACSDLGNYELHNVLPHRRMRMRKRVELQAHIPCTPSCSPKPCSVRLCRAKEVGGNSGNYEIRTAFPHRAYADPHETLRAARLTPNATVFIKPTVL